MKKLFISFLFLLINLNASVVVIKASKNIPYKEKIQKSHLYQDKVSTEEISRYCKPIVEEDLFLNQYRAKSHIKAGNIICRKDLYVAKKSNKVIFNFGNLSIERNAKVIKETEKYIRIKNENGKVEKIYKDGRDY